MLTFFFFFSTLIWSEKVHDHFHFFNKVNNYKNKNHNPEKLIFRYFNINTETSDFKYVYNPRFNVEIPEKFQSEIIDYLLIHCNKKEKVRIKQISNLNKADSKSFITNFVVSCVKNERKK